jgi:hypothetical protein
VAVVVAPVVATVNEAAVVARALHGINDSNPHLEVWRPEDDGCGRKDAVELELHRS